MNRYPTHQSIVAFDVEAFSAPYRDDRAQLAVRTGIYRVVREAFAVAGIRWDSCVCEDRGDGAIVIVPPEVSKVLLLDPLPHALLAALTEHNRRADLAERIRMRVVVHAGEITQDEYGLSGHDLIAACRLLDTTELRDALADTDVPLALIVSDIIYESIVRHGYRRIDVAAYHPVSVRVKQHRLRGWVYLPGTTVPPAVAEPAEARDDDAVPHQLLPALGTFAGRDAELRLLDKLSDQPQSLLVVVGPPGVGKTALVTHWAHQASDRYPDGQLHADLGGPGTAVAPERVLGHFLRALGVPAARIPLDGAELAAMFRSRTANARLLVILDNASSAAQVRMFRPASPSTTTIVTSRSRLGPLVTDAARFVEVGPLSEPDGVRLLARLVDDGRVERDPAGARQLTELCSGLPVALCVAGARLVLHPHWTVTKVLTDLLDEHRRLARLSVGGDLSVRVVFDMSYQALSDPAARLYRLLGLHPGPDFELGVAAAVLAIRASEAEGLIDQLLTANLLDETSADRYRFHDLIRLHARQQAETVDTEVERARALRRMIDWYLHTATAAGTRVTPHRTDIRREYAEPPIEPAVFTAHADALDWLDRERVNLLAAARAAERQGWQATAWQLADAMWGLFLYHTHYYDWLQFDLLAVRATRECADRIAEAGASDRLGLLFHALGRNDEALEHMAQAAAIWQDAGDRHRIAGSLERSGFAHLDQGHVELALDHFERALTGYRELGQARSVGLALVSIGRALLKANRARDAVPRLTEAATVLDNLDVSDPYNSARAQIALGLAEIRVGDRDAARSRLTGALRTMQSVNSPLGEADACLALGELHEATGHLDLAREYYTRTERIYVRLGNPGTDRVRDRIRGLS